LQGERQRFLKGGRFRLSKGVFRRGGLPDDNGVARGRSGGSIDEALRLLGAVWQGEQDEFDSVGLGRHRRTGLWLGGD